VAAQNSYERHRYDAPTSSHNTALLPQNDIEYAAKYILQTHSALVDRLAAEDSLHRTVIRIEGANRLTRGDFLHYEGNHANSLGITAGGSVRVKGVGTLFGSVAYVRNKMRGAYQNYAINAADYAPYLVGDTVSNGAVASERYFVQGGLSHTRGSWSYGVSGLYDGTAAAKDSQPRRSVYSYWLRVALSVAKTMPHYVLSASVYPEINKQTIAASSTLTTYRYLQSYGLGQWNRKESTPGYAYSRDMKIIGVGADVLFQLPKRSEQSWSMLLAAGFNYRYMQTEESSFKNLYATRNYRLTHSVAASKSLRRDVELHLLLQGELLVRRGEENVYEDKRQDAEQSLYDHVLVGTNWLYHLSTMSEQLQSKIVWQAARQHFVSGFVGARLDHYSERYDSPQMNIKHLSLTTNVGLGYCLNIPRNRQSLTSHRLASSHFNDKTSLSSRQKSHYDRLEVQLFGSYRAAMNNEYNAVNNSSDRIETAQAYIPYLLRGENQAALTLTATYSHALRRGRIGIEVLGKYLKRTAAPHEPVYNLDLSPHHNNNFATLAIFYSF